jgi:hypothetical protein
VRSRSSRPTRVLGDWLSRDRASWTEEDDLPTPPVALSASHLEWFRCTNSAILTLARENDHDVLH